MPARRYKVWHWGSLRSDGGVSETWNVAISTVAKGASPETTDFTVANELICARLGSAVGLPMPAYAIIERDSKPYFASLNFNIEGQLLPPVDVRRFVTEQQYLVCGILAFDVWVVNPDRHARNLSYNTATKRTSLYDHQHAFLGCYGRSNLEQNKDELGISAHCLATAATSLEFVWAWADRIKSLPTYFINDTIRAAADIGLPAADMDYCCQFLLERKSRLLELFRKHRKKFSSAQRTIWDADYSDEFIYEI